MTALLALCALVVAILALRRTGALEREGGKLKARLLKLELEGSWPTRPAAPAATPLPTVPSPAAAAAPPAPPAPVARPVTVTAAPAAARAEASPPPAQPPAPHRAAAAAESSGRGWEALLGGQVLVWLGAAAMALAVVFLVRKFAGHLWLKPEFRLAVGSLLGVGLLATGEWLRHRSARVASGTSAAGIAALFAVSYAATGIYGLISPAAGFAFLALVALAAVLLSLRQGLLVAVLGLVGGFATPALVGSDNPQPALLFGYLVLLQAAIFAVSRRGGWWPLALVNVVGGLVWVTAWLLGPFQEGDSLWLGLFLLGSTALAIAAGQPGRDAPAPGWRAGLVRAGLLGSLVALAAVTGVAGYGLVEWSFVFVVAAAAVALARLAPRFRELAWLAAALVALLLAKWGSVGVAEDLVLYFGVVAAALVLFAAVPYGLYLRAAAGPGWAILAASSLVVFPLLAHLATWRLDLPLSRGLVSLVLAGLAVAAAVPLARRRGSEGTAALGAFAAAATTLVSLAIPLELEREWWSVGWALEVPALAWLATRLGLPLLGRLGLLVAAAVFVRLVLNPAGWRYPIGDGALLNWLAYGYGVPVLALGGAAALARGRGSRRQGALFELAAVAIGLVWIGRAVHQYFQPGLRVRIHFVEAAWMTALACVLGLLLVHWGRRRERSETELAGLGATLVGLLMSLGALSALSLFSDGVGETPILNALLPAFGVPALVLGWLALRELTAEGWRKPVRVLLGVGSLGYTFLWLTLEVRRFFRGSNLGAGEGSNAEGFAYSAAWMLLGTALLVVGLRRDQFALRLGGLGVLALAAVKVFLFDVGALGDLYRVLSFFGLGASLLGLGYLYQRFVRDSPDRPESSDTQ